MTYSDFLEELGAYAEPDFAAFQKKTDRPIWSFGHIRDAFSFALEKKQDGDLVFIAGSLYLAGSIKALLKEAPVKG